MKYLPNIAGALLGVAFLVFGLNYFLNFLPMPGLPEGSPAAAFMGAIYTTGFLGFVKVLEITGGVLVAFPKTRIVGLVVLGPIIANILAFHIFLTGGAGLFGPPLILALLSLFLVWHHRRAFGAFFLGRA